MATAKKSLSEQLAIVHQTIQQFKNGAPASAIKAALPIKMDLRTLQRRLAALVTDGKIEVRGNASARQYYALPSSTVDVPETTNDTTTIPLTHAAKEILQQVRQPIEIRRFVTYNQDLLVKYQPNVSFYLLTEERIKLAELGRTARINEPAGTYAREILNRLLIDLSFNSSRLEGNTYSLLDTEYLIGAGRPDPSKSPAETQMILNHKDAIEFLVQSTDEIGFNRYTITNLHALLSNNLLPNPAASGRLRNFAVGIGGSVYTPLDIPQQIENMFELLLQKASQIEDPFEQAFFVMVHLPYLQPFDDVNKRVSRLAANIPLNKHNLIPLSFTDVPGHLYIHGLLAVYELNRVELLKDVFLWAYERSAARYKELRQTLGEPDPYRLKYRDAIRDAVAAVVTGNIKRDAVHPLINAFAEQVPMPDAASFEGYVLNELDSLHDGNFARYRIRPSQFYAWKESWKR